VNAQDLIVLSADRSALAEVVDRFPDLPDRYTLVVDRRRHARRRADMEFSGRNLRRSDRRQTDLSERLRTDGWAIVPGARRSP